MKEGWFEYINKLPREQMALAQRMRLLQPIITGPSTIQVTVNSPQMINELNELKADLEHVLRFRLKNSEINFTFELAKQEVVKRTYSK